MARRIIAEADVEHWVKRAGVTEIVLCENDVVTALARDAAYELGLRFVEAAEAGRAVETAATIAKPAGAGWK